MILFQDGKKFLESKYTVESEFEQEIVNSNKLFFGNDVIYIDTKKKIGSHTLGKTIPDGFLFDMSDPDNREFYLVEVELECHDFYNHIFQQITKFFAFFKNSKRQKELVEKLFSTINTATELKQQFKKYLGEKEIFKFLNDVVDSSQNILIVIDGDKPELPEIMDTYSDTWGKMVKVIVAKKFTCDQESIFSIHPEFETLEYSPPEVIPEREIQTDISEEYHLEGVKDHVKQIYAFIKDRVLASNPSFIFNPQKHYISIRGKKNIAFIYPRKAKVRLIPMMPEEEIRQKLKHHNVKTLSESVQRFYNNPCASVDVNDLNNIDEIIDIIKTLMEQDISAQNL
jgi:predicted transport protein